MRMSKNKQQVEKEIVRLKQTAAEKAEWSRGRERDKLGSPTKKAAGQSMIRGDRCPSGTDHEALESDR